MGLVVPPLAGEDADAGVGEEREEALGHVEAALGAAGAL